MLLWVSHKIANENITKTVFFSCEIHQQIWFLFSLSFFFWWTMIDICHDRYMFLILLDYYVWKMSIHLLKELCLLLTCFYAHLIVNQVANEDTNMSRYEYKLGELLLNRYALLSQKFASLFPSCDDLLSLFVCLCYISTSKLTYTSVPRWGWESPPRGGYNTK